MGRRILIKIYVFNCGCISTTVMEKMTSKINLNRGIATTWNIQVGNFTTTENVKTEFFLPEFSAMKTVTWKYHMDNFTEIRCGIILSVYLLTSLGIDIKILDITYQVEQNRTKGALQQGLI